MGAAGTWPLVAAALPEYVAGVLGASVSGARRRRDFQAPPSCASARIHSERQLALSRTRLARHRRVLHLRAPRRHPYPSGRQRLR